MKIARLFLWLPLLAWLAAAGRDGFDAWVDATNLPPLTVETSVEVFDRSATLLRAYTVEDGRWRLAVGHEDVAPDFIAMLVAYEDKRFWRHNGVDLRAGLLTPEAARSARADPLPHTRKPLPNLAPHLADAALAERPELTRHDLTIDAGLQAQLEALAARAGADYGTRLSVAAVVLDHQSGDILASVGSPDYGNNDRQGYVDMTAAFRSPGSTLKPLIFGLAFDEGLVHPETPIDDRPVRFGSYAPQNFDGTFWGKVRVREALVWSLNIPAVSLTQALGPARLMAALRRAGVEARLPGGQAGLAVALGGVGVRLTDMVGLYGIFGASRLAGWPYPCRHAQPAQCPAHPSGLQDRHFLRVSRHLGDRL